MYIECGRLLNSKKSDEFPASNGVRQGGVLSPILFTDYIDDLLLELKRQGIGCYWNKHFFGAICYADDLTLLAPSPSAALHLMLNTCSSFATSHNLIFNADKTQLIRFSRTPEALSTMQLFLHIIVAIFRLRTQLSTLVISFIQMIKILFVCRKISLIKLANCMLHSFLC